MGCCYCQLNNLRHSDGHFFLPGHCLQGRRAKLPTASASIPLLLLHVGLLQFHVTRPAFRLVSHIRACQRLRPVSVPISAPRPETFS